TPGSLQSQVLISGVGKCLDLNFADLNKDGGKVQVWDCNGLIQQTWRFKNGSLINGAGKCLDVYAPELHTNSGRVQVFNCNGSIQKKWKVKNGNLMSGGGICLDVYRPEKYVDGAKVQVFNCNGSVQQKGEQKDAPLPPSYLSVETDPPGATVVVGIKDVFNMTGGRTAGTSPLKIELKPSDVSFHQESGFTSIVVQLTKEGFIPAVVQIGLGTDGKLEPSKTYPIERTGHNRLHRIGE